MLKKNFGKLITIFLLTLVGLVVLFLGISVFLNWKNYQYNDAKLRMLRNKDEYKEAERENRQSELEKKQIEQIERQLAGFQPKPKDTEPLSWCKDGYLGIKGIDEAKNTIEEGAEAVLIYTEEQKKHFIRILEDIDDFLNNEGKLNLNVEGESGRNDQYKNFLLRNNCILYGAPGTGKTEFVKELNHVLINRYGKNSPERPSVVNLDPSDPNHGLTSDDEEKKPEPTIPIFVVSGASLMSTGKDEPKTFEKFIITLKKAKNDFFKNPDEEGNIGEDSKLPYIVFVDEADQAKNSLTYNPQAKNNLEEFKNFFSQAEDGGGLKKEAQDLNSICIFATNNYETIDPAMKRRGRLGTSLNFTWNPNTFWKYSEGRINWPVNDPNWKFGENEDYPELFREAEKMNFDNFESKFIGKTNDILNLWSNWNKKEQEDFARGKLGLSNRRWCPSCYEEVEPEKPSAKSRRIREAIKDIEDQEEKARIKNEEEEKDLCGESHETEPFANWLLHYLHTFFYYYQRQDLESFDKPQKIMRYNFDDKKLLRERIRLLEKEINEGNTEMINTFGGELRSISSQIEKMSDLSGKNYEEFQNINQTLENLYQRLKDYYDSKS